MTRYSLEFSRIPEIFFRVSDPFLPVFRQASRVSHGRLAARCQVAPRRRQDVQEMNRDRTADEYRLTVVSGISTRSLLVTTLKMWVTT